jgi:error-prone DNA polymerase
MPESVNLKLREPPPAPADAAPAAHAYAELDVTTNFTFLRGASHPDELVFRAAVLGHRAIAVTDRNSLAGVVRAYDAANQVTEQGGVPPKLIVGARLAFADGAPDVLVYPTDRAAYARLCRLLTTGKRRAEKGQCTLHLDDLLANNEGLLAAVVPDDFRSTGYQPVSSDNEKHGLVAPATWAGPRLARSPYSLLREAFGDRLSLAAAALYGGDDATHLAHLAALAKRHDIPLLATNHVHYHAPSRRQLQDVLTCVRDKCTVEQAGYRLFPNDQRYLKSPEQMHRLFADHPRAIRRGLEIADQCHFSLAQLQYEYPHELVPDGMTPIEYLRQLAYTGAAERYAEGSASRVQGSGEGWQLATGNWQLPDRVRNLLDHELALIEELKFEPYFLTVHDLVRFARGRGILCQGRGSAANSAVCYCLGVTSVDPAKIDVLFERFISAARKEPPDIDVDFEHERREEVIQYLYDKYGRDRAGMTAEVITYRGRSAVRDVGKALGLSLDMVDQMAKKLDWWHRGTLTTEMLVQCGLDPADRTIRKVIDLTTQLLGFPRHLSQHVGGMVMTRGPLCEMVPIENASMPDRTVIEWDKDDIDTVGILKVDALALGMLTCISKAFALLNRRHGGTEARRHGVVREGEEEKSDGNTDLPGSEGLAAGDGAGPLRLHVDPMHAGLGAVRPDQPDAPGGGVDPVEHRRRVCPPDDGRLHQVPPNGPRVAGGTVNSGRDRAVLSHDPSKPPHGFPPSRSRPYPASPDPQPRREAQATQAGPEQQPLTPPPSPPTSCLRASMPSCLKLELHTIPPDDPAVYDMISDADTVGVFQIESRAQMTMLPRLRPRCFYDLVIEVAIVRPGPIQGDMVHPYLRRRNGEEAVTYPSAALRDVLHKTLGVPLFQEQAMRVAMVGAGFTAAEADQLRRAMAAWRKSGAIETFYPKIIGGMLRNGYTREFAEQCFNQIKGFGEYGFPESHAASFALLVYVSAWIKRYHPAAFAAALLNSQPMGFYAPAQLVRDAKEHGVGVLSVDVNHSDWDCTLEEKGLRDKGTKGLSGKDGPPAHPQSLSPSVPQSLSRSSWGLAGPALRLGLRLVKGLREAHGHQIEAARRRVGRFASIAQFHRATALSAHAVRRLAEADAFGSLNLTRRQATWEALALKDDDAPLFDGEGQRDKGTKGLSGKDGPPAHPQSLSPSVPQSLLPPMPLGQEVMTDYATTTLSLKQHPLALVRDHLRSLKVVTAADVTAAPAGRWVKVAGLVLIRQRPGTASGIVFETLEDETGVVNLIVRPDVFDRYRPAARHAGLLQADGYVERQGQVVHVMAKRLFDLSHLLTGHQFNSRDFH